MTEIIKQDGMVSLEISESEFESLKDIARDGQANFVGLKKEGLEICHLYKSD